MGIDEKFLTSTGQVKAGAKVPEEVGAGGRAVVPRHNMSSDFEQRTENKIDEFNKVLRMIGYDMLQQRQGLKDSVKNTYEKLTEGNANIRSLPMWMKAIRQEHKVSVLENSLGFDLIKKIKDEYGMTVAVYPVNLYREAGFPNKNVDFVVDVDVEPGNEFAEPIFRTFKVVQSEELESYFVSHHDRVSAGVDYTIQVIDRSDEKYNELLEAVAKKIVKDAKSIHDKVYRVNTSLPSDRANVRIVNFKENVN